MGTGGNAEKEGIVRDKMKNEALLTFSPPGSYVVRINHHNKCDMEETIFVDQHQHLEQEEIRSLLRGP